MHQRMNREYVMVSRMVQSDESFRGHNIDNTPNDMSCLQLLSRTQQTNSPESLSPLFHIITAGFNACVLVQGCCFGSASLSSYRTVGCCIAGWKRCSTPWL
jgi:hypothetical protein